ncbi:MAG: hypothetical protein IPM69_16110 [Ignavibacteria bacterium]|nr:hypothetical protein [Ignavibacteria bacterium]
MNYTHRIKHYVSALGIVTSLLFASCGDCRWIEDCRCKDGGYWDCPPAPVEPMVWSPIIGISIEGERFYNRNTMQTKFTSKIKNSGSGVAKNVSYSMKVLGYDFKGNMLQKTMLNDTKNIGILQPSGSYSLTNSVSDIAVSGGGIYSVSLVVTYTDEAGKTSTTSEYISY